MVRPRNQNAPRKIAKASPAGYSHVKAAQKSTKDKWRRYVSDLPWSRLGCGASRTTVAEKCGIFQVLLALLFPATGRRGKASVKMN